MITLTADRWKADDGGGWIVADREPMLVFCNRNRRHVIDLAVPCDKFVPHYSRPGCKRCNKDGQVIKRVWLDGPPLPMHDGGTKLDAYPDDALYFTKGEGWWRDTDFDKIIDLPSAARPGMYAQHVVEVTL